MSVDVVSVWVVSSGTIFFIKSNDASPLSTAMLVMGFDIRYVESVFMLFSLAAGADVLVSALLPAAEG